MSDTFYTLQEFLTHTEGNTYTLIVVIIFAMLIFWRFLAGKEED